MAESLKDTVLAYVAMTLFAVLFWSPIIIFVFCIFFPPLIILFLPYFAYIYFNDSLRTGGKVNPTIRNYWLWKYLAAYFPGTLIVEEQLDPSQKYILGAHPHGVFTLGLWVNVMTNGAGATDKLKGLNYRGLTIRPPLYMPILRDYLMALGFASVSKDSCDYLLKHGISIALCPGGQDEQLISTSGAYTLVLKKRKGFIKLALNHGANLVPVFSFGENELFDQTPSPRGTWIRKVQDFLRNSVGFALPLFRGSSKFPAFPKRLPLTTVIGVPIPVEKKENPTEEDIEELQKKYIDEVIDIYNRYNDKYTPNCKLNIIA